MPSFQQCKSILNASGKKYTDEEVLQVMEWSRNLAATIVKLADQEERNEQYVDEILDKIKMEQ